MAKELADNLVFLGEIKGGKFYFKNRPMFNARIAKQPDTPKVHVRIVKPKNKRTVAQNNLYWLYLERVAADTGNTDKDALHEEFKRRFLFKGTRFITIKGERREVKLYKSTADLNKNDFTEYLMAIEADTGCPIPDTEAWKMEGLDIEEYMGKRLEYPESSGEVTAF